MSILIRFTRNDYRSGVCTHLEFYSQFVTAAVNNNLSHLRSAILSSTDPDFNDIPLATWDLLLPLPSDVRAAINKTGTGGVSLADAVCTYKAAAEMIRKHAGE